MTNSKIKIYSLDGCSICEKLLKLIEYENIDYSLLSCKNFPNKCDNIESITGCNMYPMVEISNNRIILCLSNQYSDLGKINKNDYEIYYFHSIDNMFYIIKKLYY